MTPQSPPYRVLIVDDVPAVREALRWVLENERDLLVVGEAGDGIEALDCAIRLMPDIVMLDLELPMLDGYTLARMLKALPRPPMVIVLTVHCDPQSRRRCAEAGIDGFVDKGTGWAALIAQIRHSLAGR